MNMHIPLVKSVQELNGVAVWRMPSSVSQSKLAGRDTPSNACTIIAVRMAEVIHRTDTRMPTAICGKPVRGALLYKGLSEPKGSVLLMGRKAETYV
ncbi:hypothetical protein KIN20_010380 [Parelaphostrongylus tenuis]|uniref:Uncharacterized protein n=1 Tax=Parelaphostrongylus tenuis TaxID=148309 RepID=A0AAD5MU09_PARTN|nr:hypothetical protein KIN20_010380 [Parelaphostrongylus tenuis]